MPDISITIEAQTAVDKAVERAKKKQAADQPDWKSIPKGQRFELLRERFDLYNFFICAIKLEFQLFNYSTDIARKKKPRIVPMNQVQQKSLVFQQNNLLLVLEQKI